MRLRGLATAVALVLVTAAGCSSDGGDEWNDYEFGLGSKADGGECDAQEPLCWPSADLGAMQRAIESREALDLNRTTPDQVSSLLDLLILGLGHKLSDEQIARLEALRPAAAALPPDATQESVQALLQQIDLEGYGWLHNAYWAAQMVPIGRAAEILIDEGDDEQKLDEAAGAAAEIEPERDESAYSEGVRQSLEQLRASFIGRLYAAVIERSGVLEADYELINAINFGEYDAEHDRILPTGLSREARVERIIDHYSLQAGLVGTGAGVINMVNPIPVLGDAVVVSGELAYLFYNHIRMVLEIASVYGMDFREGLNLYNLVGLVMEEGLTSEIVDVGISNIVLPLLARRVSYRLGLSLPDNLAADLANRSIRGLMRVFSRRSQEALADAAARGAWRFLGSKVLAWVTLGAAVVASGVLDYVVTEEIGEDAAVFTHAWLADLMLDGTTHLHRPAARDCAFTGLAAMATADGEVTEREARLYQAMLAKPYNVDEQSWIFLHSDERVRQSRRLAEMTTAADRDEQVARCLAEQFAESLPQHKLSLLAYLYGMMQVDLEERPAEAALYDSVVDLWDGGEESCMGPVCWGGGAEVDLLQLDFAERAMILILHPNAVEVSAEYEELMAGVTPEQMLDYLESPTPEIEADFRCGYEGLCD